MAPNAHHVDAQFIPPSQTYENSADADLAYAMRLQEEEEQSAADDEKYGDPVPDPIDPNKLVMEMIEGSETNRSVDEQAFY